MLGSTTYRCLYGWCNNSRYNGHQLQPKNVLQHCSMYSFLPSFHYHNNNNCKNIPLAHHHHHDCCCVFLLSYSILPKVTRLGDFWKFWLTNLLTKVAQIFGKFLCYFESHHLFSKNCGSYFFGNYWKFWATFYSNFWSHWFSRFYPHKIDTHSRCTQWEGFTASRIIESSAYLASIIYRVVVVVVDDGGHVVVVVVDGVSNHLPMRGKRLTGVFVFASLWVWVWVRFALIF